MPDLIEQGKAEVRKRCPDCDRAFVTEWGKRMAARIKVSDLVNVAIRAYEKRLTKDELSEFLEVRLGGK